MAAAFNASPNNQLDGEVAIILSSRRPLSDCAAVPERRLVLTREDPSIRIGRASKVPTKGFVAAKENAWFDSPVMSRQHAEIIANFDTNPKTVSIRDIGSLHGTFHTPNDGLKKETRLEPQQPVKLATGDILRFGIDIFRSKETFPPCSVDFLVEEKMQPPTTSTKGTFSVPDDIDDDDMDYMSEISENDMVFDLQPDGRVLIPPSHPPPQAPSRVTSRHTLSIDLTGEDTEPSDAPNRISGDSVKTKAFIDLTSEPDQESDAELDAPIPNPPARQAAQLTPAAAPATSQVGDSNIGMQQPDRSFETDYTSDQEEVGFRVDYDDESDDEDLLRLADNSLASEDSEMSDSDDSENDIPGPTLSEFGDELEATFNAAEASEEDEDNLNKTSYYEDSILSSGDDMHDTMLDSPWSQSTPPTSSKPTVKSFNAQKHVVSTSPKNCPSPSGPFAPASFSASIASSVPQVRQPSPSDAAMFKSRPVLNQSPSISRAQALGEKTGKFEFFAARENNRVAMSCYEAAVPVSAIRETLQSEPVSESSKSCPAEDGDLQTTYSLAPPEVAPPETTSELQDNTTTVNLRAPSSTQDSAWSTSGERFINNPRTDELPPLSANRAQSPDLDMTSAYTFQKSKLATEARARQSIRRLPIQDLLAQEPKDTLTEVSPTAHSKLPRLSEMERSPAGTKRSFEDAFDGDDEPVVENISYKRWDGRMVAPEPLIGFTIQPPTSSHPTHDIVSVREAVSSTLLDTSDPLGESQEPVVSIQKTDRPSKRLRLAKAAAYVSCAALGGAAAFSVLVSTAPF